MGGGGGRRRWAAEVGGGRQHTAAHGSTRRTAAGGREVGDELGSKVRPKERKFVKVQQVDRETTDVVR